MAKEESTTESVEAAPNPLDQWWVDKWKVDTTKVEKGDIGIYPNSSMFRIKYNQGHNEFSLHSENDMKWDPPKFVLNDNGPGVGKRFWQEIDGIAGQGKHKITLEGFGYGTPGKNDDKIVVLVEPVASTGGPIGRGSGNAGRG